MRKKDGMLMDEKNARMKVEQTLLNCMERLTESEERLKRVEASSRENKNALGKVYKCISYPYAERTVKHRINVLFSSYEQPIRISIFYNEIFVYLLFEF